MTLSRLRIFYRAIFGRAYALGYRAGMEEAAHVAIPAELIAAYWVYADAPYPTTNRDELRDDLIELLSTLISGEKEHG